MIDNDTKEMMTNALFADLSFDQTWMEIMSEYNRLGFHDKISDEEMIDEFKYIAQQMRKYKFSKQDFIMVNDTYEGMAEAVATLIGSAPEYGKTRKEIVYNFLRDQWLVNLHSLFLKMIEVNDDYDYEEEDDA